ncbi:MAG: response regulator [Chloroflexota bacterium]
MSNTEQKRILVIDDDAMSREVMEAFLSSENYIVSLASNGTDGIASAEALLPDAIILDVRMPDMSGYDVCLHLKAQASTELIPIMIVTGFDDRRDFERGKEVGADEFLTRPFDGDDLLERVNKMVNS